MLSRLAVGRSVVRLGASGSGRTAVRAMPFSPAFQARAISSKDIFNADATPLSGMNIPDVPLPPAPAPSIEELVASGASVLQELGLWQWWKPSSYFRSALEGIHSLDVPWWATIVAATVVLRLALIYVPVLSQRLVAKQSMYKKELDAFKDRTDDARREGNNLLQQQIFLEQRDFLRSKDIKLGRQFLIMAANGGVFMTQFFAIKKMIEVNYPGLSTGGTAWFTDLTACDPYYALPAISALTMAAVTKVGIEFGTSTDSMPPAMRLGMQYGLPVIIFVASSQFGSGLCVYWCASNVMSLVYSVAFKNEAIRKVFNIPPVVVHAADPKKKGAFKEFMANYKANKQTPPSISSLREQDLQAFKKAGRGKPVGK